jgi:5-methylcytosine-specific restriction endonuclease McrA
MKSEWEDKFLPKLSKYHGTHSKKVFHRLMKKSSTLRSSLKRRSRDYEVLFSCTLFEIRQMLYKAYGKKCKYCKKTLLVDNIVCDHVKPISHGGASIMSNLQLICKSCNIKKGPLTHKEFNGILKFLKKEESHVRAYVLRKLATKEVFK